MRAAQLRRLLHLSAHIRRPSPSLSFPAKIPSFAASFRRFCTPSDDQSPPPPSVADSEDSSKAVSDARNIGPLLGDVSNKELKHLIEEYSKENDESGLEAILEALLKRRLSKKHEETDGKLLEELRMKPRDDIADKDFESDREEALDTDEEIDDLYSPMDYVRNKMLKDPFFNMDDRKWDDMIKEATEEGFLKDTRECEEILEDMLSFDKLLPDKIKKKVEARFNELGDMCERGEMDVDQAYQLYKEFEDQMVLECAEIMEAEAPPEEDAIAETDKKVELDDPPGEGPILRWESRVVFAPGGDAWHPKNRKVKLSVTVKELGLSKYAFRRLREVVGKRYHSGRDELTITSERFEHREENRKDCLRTLYALIEDATTADKLAEETRKLYVKDRLKSNPHFMERLKAKAAKTQGSPLSAQEC